jgi:hypothetical protein
MNMGKLSADLTVLYALGFRELYEIVKGLEYSRNYIKPLFGTQDAYEENMLAYELYLYDEIRGYNLIGILPERRKDPKRITKESVIKWGRILLGDNANDEIIFFIHVKIDNITGHISEEDMVFNSI